MKKTIVLGITLLFVLATLTSCASNNEKISWAKKLKESDILKIEAVRMPALENERYKDFEKTDFARIVEIINNAKGKPVSDPKNIYGGGITFYITMTNGVRHTFSNNGNIYLVIDGTSFSADYNWLSTWSDSEALNDRVPENFEW